MSREAIVYGTREGADDIYDQLQHIPLVINNIAKDIVSKRKQRDPGVVKE